MTDVQENETASDELRVCPMRDAICPHGMDCPYTDGYNCKPGWNARIALPTADGAQQPVTHSEQLRNSLQSVADELSKRPAELRGPFTMPTHQDAKREFEVMVAGPDGWSDWLRPVGDKYRMKCCDCGLVHNMEFRIDGNENINFRMSRGDTHPAPAPGPADAVSEAEVRIAMDASTVQTSAPPPPCPKCGMRMSPTLSVIVDGERYHRECAPTSAVSPMTAPVPSDIPGPAGKADNLIKRLREFAEHLDPVYEWYRDEQIMLEQAASCLAAYQAKVGKWRDMYDKATARLAEYAKGWTDDKTALEAQVAALTAEAAEAKVVEALLPEPAYWIVTWPGKSQGVHAAYGDIEEAKHAAKNIANYSTKKTETTIVPLYTAPASDLWKDRYESLLADAQRMEASIGARDE